MKHPLKRRSAPTVDLHGAFLRRTSLRNARLLNANLAHADFSHADFTRSDFLGARLTGTVLRGADLTDALNLTLDQLAEAIVDEHTKLPAHIDRTELLARSTLSSKAAEPLQSAPAS